MHHEETLKLMDQCRGIFITKNTDYGGSFVDTFCEFGIISPLTRISDKFNRIKQIIKNNGAHEVPESIEDSLMDLGNYAIMTAAAIRVAKDKEKNNGVEGT